VIFVSAMSKDDETNHVFNEKTTPFKRKCFVLSPRLV